MTGCNISIDKLKYKVYKTQNSLSVNKVDSYRFMIYIYEL
jgi:hypothetical protein